MRIGGYLRTLCVLGAAWLSATAAAPGPQAPSGAPSAVELRRWAEQGFDAEEARSWTTVGIGPVEARQWRNAGIEFAEWANQWKGEGFTAAEAGLWARDRVNVYTARDFRDAGFSTTEARTWIDRGVRSALRAKEFRDRGFTPADAGEWWRLEFFPEDAAAWRDEGLSAHEALEWKYGKREYAYLRDRSRASWRSVYSIEWARPWKAAGFSVAEARLAGAYNVSFAEAAAWRRAGFGFAEGVAWMDSGFKPDAASVLKAAGLSPVQAAERNGPSARADAITSFDSDIRVQPDATMDVAETIVIANSPGGSIDRCFTRTFSGRITLRYGESSVRTGWPSYRLVSVLHNGAPASYRVEREPPGGLSLCIGGADTELPEGSHAFVLRYRTTDRLIELHDQDRLFFDVAGSALTIPVRHASATVRLPKGADTVLADGFAGPRNRKYFDVDVQETGDGDVIAYTVTRPLAAEAAFAVGVNLRKGIVQPGVWQRARRLDFDAGRLFSSLAIFAAGLGAAFLYFIIAWHRVGRDPKRGVVVPVYVPPGGMSPALMRYLVSRRRVDDKTMAATLVRLAECGRLVIREREGRYRIEKGDARTVRCEPHEAEFGDALFTGGTELTLGTRNAKSRLRAARRVLRTALRAELGKHVATHRRYVWPGLVLSVAGTAAALVVLEDPPIHAGAYVSFLAMSVAGLNVVFGFLLKTPTRHARRLLDDLEGFRQFLEASYSAPSAVPGSPARGLPPAAAEHLPYAIALGIDVERVSILDDRRTWYAGQSGGFSAADFTRAFGRLTSRAVKI